MNVKIDWGYIDGEDDDDLDLRWVLYAYVHPDDEKILYLGKADKCSVRERLKGKHKKDIFDFFQNELGLTSMGLLVGELLIPESKRFSSELLSDIESLLISTLQPCANIQSTRSRIERPGLSLTCVGDWPLDENQFLDD
ncbi:MAG: hypothetical protein ABW168_00345 [Sedimenticola sp.]